MSLIESSVATVSSNKHRRLVHHRSAPRTRLSSPRVYCSPGEVRYAKRVPQLEQNKLTVGTAPCSVFTVLQLCLVGTKCNQLDSVPMQRTACVYPSGYLHPVLMNANNS